jgi:hypothetical protein
VVLPAIKIHLPSHCAHAKDWSFGAPGKWELMFSTASIVKGKLAAGGAGSSHPSLPEVKLRISNAGEIKRRNVGLVDLT